MLLQYLAIAVLIFIAAFFSGSETSYAAASHLRLKRAAENGKLSSRLALKIHNAYEDALITMLIGNNLVNIAASSIATVIAISLLGENGAWAATGVMTVLILIFGEITPKIIGNANAEDFARMVALPLRIVMILFTPFVWFTKLIVALFSKLWEKTVPDGPSVTEDDLESIIDTVEDEGVIDEERCDLLQSALDFDDVLAYEIITPRVDLVALDIGDPADENIDIALNSPHSRLPVYQDSVDNIIGILHLNHLLKRLVRGRNSLDLSDLLMPACFVHKTMALPDVLSVMRKQKSHMVIVTDEYGGTMGVLTMEDVLEQLVGDIWDETDEIVDEFVEIAPNAYEADGDMRIYDFFEELDIDDRDFDDDNATLGGWAIEMLGGYPKVGESFDYKNLTITVTGLQNMRVIRLKVIVHPVRDDEDGDE